MQKKQYQLVLILHIVIRGCNPQRASYYGNMSHLDYVKNANNEILKMMLIEQKAGYDNIEEIAQVKGVDIIALGSGDLSLDVGFSGYMNRIEIKDMISQAAKACKKYNMPFIIFPSIEKKSIETWIQYQVCSVLHKIQHL